jgi:hypothetical protein
MNVILVTLHMIILISMPAIEEVKY